MTNHRSIFWLLVCGIVSIGVQLAPALPAWQQMSGEKFICYFQQNETKICQKLIQRLDASYHQLAQQLGVHLDEPVSVYLAPSKPVFEALVGHSAPVWSDAIALPAKKTIILKSPVWNDPSRDLLSIATHELVHILLHGALNGQSMPRWLDEGLAVYYSGEKGYASSSLISRALMTKSLLSLDEIDQVLTFRADVAQLAYQQSYLAVVFLMKNYGVMALRQIIAQLASGKQLDEALVLAIGLDRWEFEQAWLQYIGQQYRWHFLVDVDQYLWILVLLLLVAGFVLMRRRNRRIIEQWNNEDEASGDRSLGSND